MAEIWAAAVATVAVGATGAVLSSQAQKNAANTAANAQLTANEENNQLSSGMYNASATLSSTSRALGGLAQQQLAYDLGLSPDLNISSTQVTPQVSSTGQVSYIDQNGNPVGGTGSNNGTGSGPTAPVTPQFDPVTQTWVTPTQGAYGQTQYAGTGQTGSTSPTAGTPPATATTGGTPAMSTAQSTQGAMATSAMNQYNNNLNSSVNTTANLPVGTQVSANPITTQVAAPGTATINSNGTVSGNGTVQSPINLSTGTFNTGSGASNNTGTGSGPSTTSTYGGLSNPYNPSTFFLSPDYQFNLSQGQAALQRAQAASGNAASGAALKDAMTFAEGLSSQDYNNAFTNSLNANAQTYNMLQGAVSGGMIGNSATQTAGQNTTTQMSSNNTNTGNAIANQAVATGNANSNLYNNITGTGLNALSKYGSQSSYSGNGGNPYNLGGSTPVAPAGSQLTYDQWGNITGSTPISN